VGREDEHLINAVLVAPAGCFPHLACRYPHCERRPRWGAWAALSCPLDGVDSADDLGQPARVGEQRLCAGLPAVVQAVLSSPCHDCGRRGTRLSLSLQRRTRLRRRLPRSRLFRKGPATKAPPQDTRRRSAHEWRLRAGRSEASRDGEGCAVGGSSAAPRAGLSECILLLAQSGLVLDAPRRSPSLTSPTRYTALRRPSVARALRALVRAPGYSPGAARCFGTRGVRSPQSWLASLLGGRCSRLLQCAGVRGWPAPRDGRRQTVSTLCSARPPSAPTLRSRPSLDGAADAEGAAALVAARASTAAGTATRTGPATRRSLLAAFRLCRAQDAGVRACLLLLVRRGLVSPAAIGGE